jgi:hypothetical protein
MNLDDFIITCFCCMDEMLPLVTHEQRLRQRGPQPQLSESEVLTMEVVGAYLGLSQDKALFAYFRKHCRHFFPALAGIHRTTFVRQAANLWAIKERLWCALRDQVVRHDWLIGIIDSMPVPVCRFARAHRSCALAWQRKPRQRSHRSADLFWVSLAPAGELAGADHPSVLGSGQ